MSRSGFKWLTILLAAAMFILLFGFANHVGLKLAIHRQKREDARSIIRTFQERRDAALHSQPKAAAKWLGIIVEIPSKEDTDSLGDSLGAIVEHERAVAIRDVLGYLRKKTGDDLGDDPLKWIKKYVQ